MQTDSMQTRDTLSALAPKSALDRCPLVAVLRWISPDEVEDLTEILIEAGFRLIEVPLNSPDPLTSIERLAKRFGTDALIGAGTVMSPSDVTRVRDAGGRLIITPHGDVTVVSAAHAQQMACFPGVATPTEGFAALQAGADGLKVSPLKRSLPPSSRRGERFSQPTSLSSNWWDYP